MPIESVVKRDGRIVPYNPDKISDAIWKAARAVGGHDKERPRILAEIVETQIIKKYGEGVRPQVEEIQDVVEKVLIEEGHAKVAKSFILYRESRKEIRDIHSLQGLFDTIEVIETYLGEDEVLVKDNANMGFSLQGLNNTIASKLIENYWLNRVYPPEVKKAHENAEVHIHDLGTLGAYCVGWDLESLLVQGFKGVEGKVACKPPKHLAVALGQMVNFFYTLQGETAGAQAFSNFDTYLAPFVKHDGLDYNGVKQAIQGFLFNMNVPTRVGFQTPFTNITMDLRVPNYMKDKAVIIGGQMTEQTYKEFQPEMDMINRAFAECMMEGDADGRVFTFPIPTYNVTKDFQWDDSNLQPIWEMTAKYGVPYFSNFVNSDMKPEDARSMCCRLRLDQNQLRKRGGGLFGANPLTGSIGVVTINLPRIGYTSETEQGFFRKLEELMDLSEESLEIKRKELEKLSKMGLYPYSRFYLKDVHERFGEYWKNHFSTIGILGMNEAIENLIPGENIASEKGRDFTIRVLDFMREKMEKYQAETGNLYNLEATPGEGTTYRFARIDKKRFPDIIVANPEGEHPYYTNSTQLPVNHTDDIFEALKLQDDLQVKYTGGTVLHGFLGERITADGARELVKKISGNFHLPYFTLTPTFSVCTNHGYIAGNHEHCPTCDSECEIWSRVVGYLRPTKNWNNGKQSEWHQRKTFEV